MFNVYVYVKKIRAVELFRPNFYEKITFFVFPINSITFHFPVSLSSQILIYYQLENPHCSVFIPIFF